jgi:hypothetical protein
MAQILVKAIDATHADPVKDRRGCYKRGMPVVVMPDTHTWGLDERPPKFVVLKLPGVPVEKVKKYIEPEREDTADADGRYQVFLRRLWKFRLDDMPTAALRKLRDNGELIIKVGDYADKYDYTWTQVRSYLRNLKTNTDETASL